MTTPAEQRDRWTRRVAQYGPTRAIFHLKHDPATLDAVTEAHAPIVLPPLVAALQPTDTTILDFGCGWGRWTRRLAEATGRQVIGVDLTPTLLAEAIRQRDVAPRVARGWYSYRLIGESGRLPLADGRVDVIWAFTVLSAILDEGLLTAALDEWRRVLAPTGLVYLIDNTSKVDGRAVRSPWSMSRTVEEYQARFADWCPLTVVGAYTDLGEINTIVAGRRVGR